MRPLPLAGCLLTLLIAPRLAYCHPVDMKAIATIESNNDPKAVGKHGEVGLYQVSPIVLKHFNQSHGKILKDVIDGKYPFGDHLEKIDANLKDPEDNAFVANWYMNWLFDRCWTVRDTLIAYNMGIGKWREWKESPCILPSGEILPIVKGCFFELPNTTQEYLKKYEQLTGEKLDG